MWIVGQRVVAELEPELGLGIVLRVEHRQIVVSFPGSEVTRNYASQRAPLRRLVLSVGQRARAKDGSSFVVERMEVREGLMFYHGAQGEALGEQSLAHHAQDSEAPHLFRTGAWTSPKAFDLRREVWSHLAKGFASPARGLGAPRVELLPHQIDVSRGIARREFPRVVLADEVGLGKTIEAGLIFSGLRAYGRADRVLILVPESLKHQWLSEVYRCFHEMFTLVDEERLEQEMASGEGSAFKANHKVICSIDFLLDSPEALEQVTEADWDLIIIDEAHHLVWDSESPSEKWTVAHALSERTRGLLLLTATPFSRGPEGLFGLLALIDSKRFWDFDEFEKEWENTKKVAQLAKHVQDGERDEKTIQTLKTMLKGDPELTEAMKEYAEGGAGGRLLRALVDRHGIGRLLVRNRRESLSGFSGRKLHAAPLEAPEKWHTYLDTIDPMEPGSETTDLIPLACGRDVGRTGAHKEHFEARAKWVAETLKSLGDEKVLLIAQKAKTVLELHQWLQKNSGIKACVFHEGLELVDRDRQAAWFADPEGARILLCSEIGGEGRNFQFCRNLIFFDLPLHPDLLEQRIGRLDRIGQKGEVQIYVPYFKDTPEEALLRWHAEGIKCFETPWTGAASLIDVIGDDLLEVFASYLALGPEYENRAQKLERLVQRTESEVAQIEKRSRESVDLLIDLNSFNQERGQRMVNALKALDADPALETLMVRLFDHFGIENEDFDTRSHRISSNGLMFVSSFPDLPPGTDKVVTFDRKKALEREEFTFLTIDHPMVQGSFELLLAGDQGRAACWLYSGAKEPGIYTELLFVLHTSAPLELEVERFLPPAPIRILVDARGKIVEGPVPVPDPEKLTPLQPKRLKSELAPLLMKLEDFIESGRKAAYLKARQAIDAGVKDFESKFKQEASRLQYLNKINPSVSKKEVDSFLSRGLKALNAIETVEPTLDAIRVYLLIPG